VEIVSKIVKMLAWVGVIFLVSTLIGLTFGKVDLENKIKVIQINGIIGMDNKFIKSSSTDKILEPLDKAKKDKTVKGVILEINSNGGTPVASKEIADKVKSLNKPVVAFVRGSALSGAYWIAASADKIVANELSLVGSIGVLGSYIQVSNLMDEYGLRYERIVAGKYKDTGSPLKEPTDEEKELLQKKVDMIQKYFLEEVKKDRKLSKDQIEKVKTAEFFLGMEAKELNLIDVFGNIDVAENVTKQLANITKAKIVKEKNKVSIIDYLTDYGMDASYNIGKGIAQNLLDENVKINT
jgi:protease-4